MNIYDIYRPFFRHFRRKRMNEFSFKFGLTAESRILDVGGSLFNWLLIPIQPKITILNISLEKQNSHNVRLILGDGCHLPFTDKSFDVVYSNSVIEHLGNYEMQGLFANEIRRVGRFYYVQTPNKWFPVEPHLITPFIHWLPLWLERKLLRNFTMWGWLTRPTYTQCKNFINEIHLLEEKEIRHLFPECEILHERLFGLNKSLIAIHQPS